MSGQEVGLQRDGNSAGTPKAARPSADPSVQKDMPDAALVETLLAARWANRLGDYTGPMATWSDERRAGVLNIGFERLRTVDPDQQVLLYQVGRAVAAERPVPFANRVLAEGGSDALLAEVCWSVNGWAGTSTVPLMLDLVRSERSIAVKRQALLTLIFTRDACVPALLAEVVTWAPDSPETQELLAFVRSLPEMKGCALPTTPV